MKRTLSEGVEELFAILLLCAIVVSGVSTALYLRRVGTIEKKEAYPDWMLDEFAEIEAWNKNTTGEEEWQHQKITLE